jgi:histidinol-phosphate aminotransferase
LLDTKRPGKEVIDAMAKQKVYIGRIWPIMPTWVRITVGTHDEMAQFQSALQKAMHATTAVFPQPVRPPAEARRMRTLPS